MNKKRFEHVRTLSSVMIILLLTALLSAQVGDSERRYVRIGDLQSHFSSFGAERAWNNIWYEGLQWPADYPYTDNAVIQRAWLAARDFTDEEGYKWDYWGTGINKAYVNFSIFPMVLTQTTKFALPTVIVDGNNISAPFASDADGEPIPDQIADRIITNTINTSLGLTITRRIYAFSQQYHNDYFIKEYILTNTGNVDYDPAIELTDTLRGVRIGWGIRYAVSRDGAARSDNQQSWGKHSWVTLRGETYPQRYTETITEATPISDLDWLRCAWSWCGQSELRSYDMIGCPDISRYGRLAGPQFAGNIIIHVDQSTTNPNDDPYQPVTLGWHAGDTYPGVGDLNHSDMPNMQKLWEFLGGTPYPTAKMGGMNRMDEVLTSIIDMSQDPYKITADEGGTNQWIGYGPWDIPPGDSIKFVEAEAVNGLSRTLCETIGRRWLQAYRDPSDKGPFTLPDGSLTDNKDLFKNSWVYSGADSVLLTFSRAKRNYDSGLAIPHPPQPPTLFTVSSGGDRITMTWEPSPSESDADFAGYKIFRGFSRVDTVYEEIADLPKGTLRYDDMTPKRGFSYYYYISAYNDGSNNTSGALNPPGPLLSGKYYTRTTEPAYLRRKAGISLADIRVVPNPYNVRAENIQYRGEPDKIMFLNIPAYCDIKIFTERGDLIAVLEHRNGSGDEAWNSISSSRQVVVSGLYIAYIEVTQDYNDPETGEPLYKKGENTYRKFVIIR